MVNRYNRGKRRGRIAKRIVILLVVILAAVATGGIVAHHQYSEGLLPVSDDTRTQKIVIKSGSSDKQIANLLYEHGLIRSKWVFEIYLSQNDARSKLKFGTYDLSPSMNTGQIVSILTDGRVASSLVTITPGSRIDQVEQELVRAGFDTAEVRNALDPSLYKGNPALTDKPLTASLEGFLYPDSYARVDSTKPSLIVRESLNEMSKYLTPDLRAAFAKQGLNTYQAITLASIIGKEVGASSDRSEVAQVFLKRLAIDMPLQSNVTALYGAIHDGLNLPSDWRRAESIAIAHNSAYNTYKHKGLPPSPISNVMSSDLDAVAHPAKTDWLYFVTGSDCKTRFAKTIDDHNQNIKKYGNGCEAN